MKMKKRYVSLLLSAILIFSASAASCGSGNENGASSQSSNSASEKNSSDNKEEQSSKTDESSAKEESTESSENDPDDIPESWKDNGIFSANYKRAYKIVKEMSVEEKTGQMILACCPAIDGSIEAKNYHLGGYVLFGRDFDESMSKDEIITNNRSYYESQKIPMIIAVDEEGGTVSRLSWNPELTDHKFRSPRELFESGGIDAIIEETKEKNTLMKSLYINTNLAPVCDICKSENEFMYDRSLGQDADITADFVERFTLVSQENGISVTLKHFPGYGNNLDTHTGVAVDDRNYETFAKNDLIPFQAGIDAGAHMVLVSHNIINCMDADHPASLSLTVHEILRNDLGFTGIIVTDNLEMDAISKYFTDYSPSVAAVLAGNDMLCVSDYTQTYNDILEAISNGTIDIDLVDHAATRIIAWKMSKGLL